MREMKKVFATLLWFTLVSSASVPAMAEQLRAGHPNLESRDVSVYRLIASPHDFDGTQVRVRGYLVEDGDQVWVFCDKAAFDVSDSSSAILLSGDNKSLLAEVRADAAFDKQHVVVEGVVFIQKADKPQFDRAALTRINHVLVLKSAEKK